MAKDPPYRIKNMMPGMIMLWYGSVESIPSGWHLCDGTGGTIDLRNKFIVCAGDTYNPSDSGGSISHSHPYSGDGHDHDMLEGSGIAAGEGFLDYTDIGYPSGVTSPTNELPPYKALCYIQKL